MTVLAVIGKFYPMTKGHLQMIEHFAHKYHRGRVYVFVCYTQGETIPVDIRYSWVKRATSHLANVEIKYVIEQLGDSKDRKSSDPNVSKVWAQWLIKHYPEITHFGGSEPYVQMMADSVGKQAVLYDPNRAITPISATLVRSNLNRYRDYLGAPFIFDEYVYKIAVVGLDSCGKSTLVHWLSNKFDCEIVNEYGRDYCAINSSPLDGSDLFIESKDLENIAYGHHKLVISAVRTAWTKKKKLVIVDTEHYVTRCFSYRYLNQDNSYLEEMCKSQHYDGYIYCDLLPLEDDGTRREASEEERIVGDQQLFNLLSSNIKERIIRVPSDYEQRRTMSIEFIQNIMHGDLA